MTSPAGTTSDDPPASRSGTASPPSFAQTLSNKLFRVIAYAFGAMVVLLLGAIVFEVMRHAEPAIAEWGLGFLTRSAWDPGAKSFGLLAEIVGTLYTSIVALALGGALGVTVALVTSQGFVSRRWESILKNVVELLAAIPSVVYGLWGIFVLIPVIRPVATFLHESLPSLPFFATPFRGPGILPASFVLAIMILPTITAVSREALAAVPKRLPAAAYALGATRWEVILTVTVPTAAGGIFGSLVLGFGRALGETMALAMLVGNAREYGWSLLAPATTIASLLANHFPEADAVEVRALMYAALVLLVITLGVNTAGSLLMMRATRELKGLS